jgi:hypothetical protein
MVTNTIWQSVAATTIVAISCVATAIILKQSESVDTITCRLTYNKDGNIVTDNAALFDVSGNDQDLTVKLTGYYIFYADSTATITLNNDSPIKNSKYDDLNSSHIVMLSKGDQILVVDSTYKPVTVHYITPDRFIISMYRQLPKSECLTS